MIKSDERRRRRKYRITRDTMKGERLWKM
jgi:hypothetical protein